jgi:hypothetical protein
MLSMHRDATSRNAWLARICIEPTFVLLGKAWLMTFFHRLIGTSRRLRRASTDEKPKIISALFFRVKYLRADLPPVVFTPFFAGFAPCPKLQKRRRA